MKAILLAGGKGTRLQPLTSTLPKPMVPLFGRPVLEHLLLLLRRHGIREAAITLGYLPRKITDYFGNGSRWGMELTYFSEPIPLGTAGGVANCMPFLQGEDCVVLSGDCLWDFDLSDAIAHHLARGAEATLLLHQVEDPTPFGLVETGRDGRVTRFLEKPKLSQVFTHQVNTGIYLLSSSVLSRIPRGVPCDFSRDVFPAMLEQGAGLYGDVLPGHWIDMGSLEAYLQCARLAMDGALSLELTLPQPQPGIYAAGALPRDVRLYPPCWIGKNVTVEPGCVIGPYAVLEQGTSVGAGSTIQESILANCTVGAENQVTGAVLCRHAQTERQVVLRPRSALGAGARVGRRARLEERVRIWPWRSVEAGARLYHSLPAEEDI